jgi:hypothetical protein
VLVSKAAFAKLASRPAVKPPPIGRDAAMNALMPLSASI